MKLVLGPVMLCCLVGLAGACGGGQAAPAPAKPKQPARADPDGGPCDFIDYKGICELVGVFEDARPSSCGTRDGEIRMLFRPTESSWLPPDRAVQVVLETEVEDHKEALARIRAIETLPCRLMELQHGTCAPHVFYFELEPAPYRWRDADSELVEYDPTAKPVDPLVGPGSAVP